VYLGLGLRLGSGTFAATAPSSLLTGLLAYWKFDDNGSGGVSLLDSSGNGRTLSAPNGTAGLDLVTGIINKGVYFNPDEYFDPDQPTYLSRSGTFLDGSRDGYSISAWVKIGSSNNFFIVDQATGNNNGRTISLDMFSDGTIYGTIYYDNAEPDRATGSTSINNGNWYHVAMTWKRTDSLKVYVNGALDGSVSSSGNYANIPTQNLSINSNADGSFAAGTECVIDEVGIWSKELSTSEIASLYNSGAGKSYPFA
jgi:hypothetical protein